MDPELLNVAADQVQQAIPFGLIAMGVGSFVSAYLNKKSAESIATDNERIALANLRQMDNAQRKSFEIAQESENFARQQWWDREQRLHPLRVAGMGAMWAGQRSPTPEVRLPSKPEPVDWGEWQSTDYGQLGAGMGPEGASSPCPPGQSRNPTTGVCEDYDPGRTPVPRPPNVGPGGNGDGNEGHWVRCPDGSFRQAGTCPDGDPDEPEVPEVPDEPEEQPERTPESDDDDEEDLEKQFEEARDDLWEQLPRHPRRRPGGIPMNALVVNSRHAMPRF